jgi:hypothetical protein
MVSDVPYMPSVKNLHAILDAIQNAGVPETFKHDFLQDLGFASSNDRPVIRLLKFIGFLSSSGSPETPYREFVDHTKSKGVLARQLKKSYDDLFLADRAAQTKPATDLKGWFKTKTGASDAVAKKMATTFRSLVDYADFDSQYASEPSHQPTPPVPSPIQVADTVIDEREPASRTRGAELPIGMVYRLEVHLPDTQNVDTYRAIFRALREELM